MLENRSSLFGIIALLIGATGLGLGIFSIASIQLIGGEQGPPGEDGINGTDGTDGTDGINGINGTDGIDGTQGPPGPVATSVGILNPDNGDYIWGNITIDALVYSSGDYNVSILLNGSSIGEFLPMSWDSSTVAQGWWNITVLVIDSNQSISQDTVLVRVDEYAYSGVQRTWYNEYPDGVNMDPPYTYITLDDLLIIFEVKAGESAYFLYNCNAFAYSTYYIKIYFVIDGFRIKEPYIWVTQDQVIPCALQYSNSTLSVGTHNITVAATGESQFAAVTFSTLLVQTYIP